MNHGQKLKKLKARWLKGGSTPPLAIALHRVGLYSLMNKEQFVIEVQKIATQSNPDLVNSTSYEDVVKELASIKDKAMRWEIIVSSFKPEPELFPLRPTLRETEARRQGQL